MGVDLKLPRGIGWITSQADPGTDTKDYIDERFAAISDLVAASKTDLDASISAMNQSLSPVVVAELEIAGITVPDLGSQIPDFTATFTKTFESTAPVFTKEFTATAPVFSGSFSESIPAFTKTFDDSFFFGSTENAEIDLGNRQIG